MSSDLTKKLKEYDSKINKLNQTKDALTKKRNALVSELDAKISSLKNEVNLIQVKRSKVERLIKQSEELLASLDLDDEKDDKKSSKKQAKEDEVIEEVPEETTVDSEPIVEETAVDDVPDGVMEAKANQEERRAAGHPGNRHGKAPLVAEHVAAGDLPRE